MTDDEQTQVWLGENNTLAGKLLVAMPFMQDTRFEQSVIFICGHDAQGAIGLVLNKVMPQVMSENLLGQMGVDHAMHTQFPIHYGGPVEPNRGFVLHDSTYKANATVAIHGGAFITSTVDILRAIACGKGPSHYITCLGYTGWAYGQLEREVSDNHWLVVAGHLDLIFSATPSAQWQQCMAALQVNPWALSFQGGRA